MHLEPYCNITINQLLFRNVNKVVIDRSVKETGSSAMIVLPRNFAKLNDRSIIDLIKHGDKAEIICGYTGTGEVDLFSGYVRKIERSIPLIIHLDDELYPLKRNNHVQIWVNSKLRTILTTVAPGYKITCPDVLIGKIEANNESSFQMLRKLQNNYGFFTSIRDGQLNCDFPFDFKGSLNVHQYQLYNWPVKSHNLTYSSKEEKKVLVKATSLQSTTGKKISYDAGDKSPGATVIVLNLPGMSAEDLKRYAESWYSTLCYDGFKGTITGFGTSVTMPGDTLQINDPQEGTSGAYMIESVKTIYDLKAGYYRENRISFKV
jgi:hypothetical protein